MKTSLRFFVLLFFLFVFLFSPKVIFAASPVGYIDTNLTNCTNIIGWTGDSDTITQPIFAHFYKDSPTGTYLGDVYANLWRESQVCRILGGGASCDICDRPNRPSISEAPQCYHGYSIPTYSSLKDGANHKLYAYAINNVDTPVLLEPIGGVTLNCFERSEISTSVNLSNLGIPQLNLYISYENPKAVGDPYPNYEYSGHIVKMADGTYKMFYGGRCVYDNNKNCQLPASGVTPETCGSAHWWKDDCYTNPNVNLGDGDHIRVANSNDGINWTWGSTPVVRPGVYDTPPITDPTNLEYWYRMDPTVIWWQPEGKYYMYYEVLIENRFNPACIDTSAACSKISYATSTDLINWTKGGDVIFGDTDNDTYKWPKAIVENGQVWLYFGYFNPGQGTFLGPKVIQSSDPRQFNFSAMNDHLISNYGGWSQHGILWPNDPSKKLYVGIVNNWDITAATGRKVPTIVFSKDGFNWFHSASGQAVSFPPAMDTLQHEFCNIATEMNGGLNPIPGNSNKIETFYYCGTFDGNSGRYIINAFLSDISSGKIHFTLPCGAAGDINCSGQVDNADLVLLMTKFGQTVPSGTKEDLDDSLKVNTFDLTILLRNFGR